MGMKKKFIRDSVYGDIRLNEIEVEVMDNPQFQRLRRIKQLGLISLIYPGANHTRFEHSIGTMHIASKLADKFSLFFAVCSKFIASAEALSLIS